MGMQPAEGLCSESQGRCKVVLGGKIMSPASQVSSVSSTGEMRHIFSCASFQKGLWLKNKLFSLLTQFSPIVSLLWGGEESGCAQSPRKGLVPLLIQTPKWEWAPLASGSTTLALFSCLCAKAVSSPCPGLPELVPGNKENAAFIGALNSVPEWSRISSAPMQWDLCAVWKQMQRENWEVPRMLNPAWLLAWNTEREVRSLQLSQSVLLLVRSYVLY